ncbi:MAG: hypothetical protein GWO87_00410 [Xanthomonadaceae bacterium]|nr:hypothetical protein [Rhodospirillaceae bacterium]NIA17643.1 hypothetical protein [Xanthomonadaceae bacterium]
MSNYISKKGTVFSTIIFLTAVLAVLVFAFYYTQLKKRFIDPTSNVFKKILFKKEGFNTTFNKEILSNSVFLKLNNNNVNFIKRKDIGNSNAFRNNNNL